MRSAQQKLTSSWSPLLAMLLAPELDWEFALPLRRLSGRHVYLIPSAVESWCGAPGHHVEAVGRNLLFGVALGPSRRDPFECDLAAEGASELSPN